LFTIFQKATKEEIYRFMITICMSGEGKGWLGYDQSIIATDQSYYSALSRRDMANVRLRLVLKRDL
jgi:hypothetical protein